MTLFTKEQAIAIKEKVNHLIGQPFDDELKITNIWIVPIDVDFEKIAKHYQFDKFTSQNIAEIYGKDQNLQILVLSFSKNYGMKILVHSDISEYLPKNELDEILNNL